MSPAGSGMVRSSMRATSTPAPRFPKSSMALRASSTPMTLMPAPISPRLSIRLLTCGSRGMSSTSAEGSGPLAGPRVVGFAAGRAMQLVEQVHGPGHLVARHLGAAVGGDVVWSRRGPRPGLDERRDPLAPLLVGHADHHGVEDVGMALQGGLDLFRIHLLAARVDADGAPPQDEHGAVGLDRRHVAREYPTFAVDLLEGPRRLLGVVVIAEGDVPPHGHASDDARAGDDGFEVVVEDGGALVHREPQALLGAGLGRHGALVSGLGR